MAVDYSGLGALLPEYQQMYESLAPQIEKSVNASTAARGMSASGAPTELATQQEQQLLASLASQSAGARQTQAENEKNRAAQAAAANKQLIGTGIGAGIGGLGTMAGLYYMMNRGGGTQNLVPLGGGKYGQMINGKLVPVDTGVAPAAAGAVPGAAADISKPGFEADFKSPSALGAGALGGYVGSELGKGIGPNNTAGDIGAGAGGLAGFAGASELYSGNPYAAAGGAALGAFGGRGLAGLFA